VRFVDGITTPYRRSEIFDPHRVAVRRAAAQSCAPGAGRRMFSVVLLFNSPHPMLIMMADLNFSGDNLVGNKYAFLSENTA